MKNLRIVTIMASSLICGCLFAATPLKEELHNGWRFKQARLHNWYPATVPGVVHTDLLDNKMIEDPFYRLNEKGMQWIDKEDWIYEKTFNASPQLMKRNHIQLVFEGLDTYADVYINEQKVLEANNMFRQWNVDIKQYLKPGDNQLKVYFHSPIKVDIPKFDALKYPVEAGNDQSENGGIFNKKVSVFARKAGYHYGWDWGPRLVTSGIWRPVYLLAWNDARIDNIHYIQEDVTASRAKIKAKVQVKADKDCNATLTIQAEGVKSPWIKNVQLKKGMNTIEHNLVVNNPRLWWTNGLGEAHLYSFTANISIDGDVADTKTDNIGIRSLKVINEKDANGHSFYFELNGQRVFAKGANYIPQDNFLTRVTDEKYEKTILDAVNVNMNMLRIWGGGIYENKVFYDLCDKYGILVWQDFMFACSTYPMNPDMLENIRQEAIDNVTRLRNHPCIAIWCGNNEMHTAWFNWGWMRKYKELGVLAELRKDYKDVFHGVLPEVVEAYDPTAFYLPSSPYGGDPDKKCESGQPLWNPNGDGHYWGVWHAKAPITDYNIIRARFFSEYGFQSFPEYQSVLKYAPEERDHDIYSDVMMAHQRGGDHANKLIESYLLNEYQKPLNFESFLYMNQVLQGDAIKTAMEAHRRDMPYCMGTLFWQHNDCWPVASWSSRDYYGRWKAQHYFARDAFRDMLVSPIAEDNMLNVYAVSDRLKASGGTLEIKILKQDGEIVNSYRKLVKIPANTSTKVWSIETEKALNGVPQGDVIVNAVLTVGKDIYKNNYFLVKQKEMNYPKATITRSVHPVDGGYEVTLTSDKFARAVFMSINGIDNFFADNYFDILPGETVTKLVTTDLTQGEFEKQLRVTSLRDNY
ncbi:glycoside hydrolase family 2 protein [Bacteroides sp. 519]|uniref:beta-mannosidase n=1 Tax=Bacteroides sp. 519 TaxID=2302937 RepID=UPI0013D22F59|nr:glycoside hydrolase family 2 protein [Bacteroides sp. 519]NDV57638.1 glycoside hydrolase family 2 protein [Bacteroides sp. 519]